MLSFIDNPQRILRTCNATLAESVGRQSGVRVTRSGQGGDGRDSRSGDGRAAPVPEAAVSAADRAAVCRRRDRDGGCDAGARLSSRLTRPLALASRAMIDNLAEPDSIEGIGAFLEKRSPVWGA